MERFPAQFKSRFILRTRLGIIAQRLAFPFRSPRPFIVPCTIVAPQRTPSSDTATPSPQSLWQWTPTCVSPICAATVRTISENSSVIVPPLVSQRQTNSAPPRLAASRVLSAYSGLSLNPSKKCSGVVNNLAAVFDEIRDGFLNHFKIFLGGGFYDLLDMQKPGFAEYRHIGRFGREKQRYLIVFRNFRVCAARRTEGRYFRMRKFYIFYLLKEGHIARIRSRPTALDEVETELVHFFGKPQFRSYRKGNSFALCSVPKGCVVYKNFIFAHFIFLL